MQVAILPTIHEEREDQISRPRSKFPLNGASISSDLPTNLNPPRTPREIHALLQRMDDHYDTNFFPWVIDGFNAPAIGSFLVSTLSEIHVTPLQLGSVIQSITSKWSVVETSFLFKTCFESISKLPRYSWSSRDWVPVLLSVTSPATIIQFMGLLLFNIGTHDQFHVHPILEVFIEGFGLNQTVSLIHALDRGWVGVVCWRWKLHVLKQWGTQPIVVPNIHPRAPPLAVSTKKRRASESILMGPTQKLMRRV